MFHFIIQNNLHISAHKSVSQQPHAMIFGLNGLAHGPNTYLQSQFRVFKRREYVDVLFFLAPHHFDVLHAGFLAAAFDYFSQLFVAARIAVIYFESL